MAVDFELDGGAAADLVDALLASFDFTLPGEAGGTLGRDLAARAAAGIADRSARGEGPGGAPWKPNAPRYAAYKLRKFAVDRPGELSGQMLGLASLLGSPKISPDLVELTYGLGTPPASPNARGGAPLSPSQAKATDRDKAGYFAASGREFYLFDDEVAAAVVELAGAAFARHLAAAGF